jgi:hypothetical protein
MDLCGLCETLKPTLARIVMRKITLIVMKNHLLKTIMLACLLFPASGYAQRGFPPKQKTSAVHVTKYPQHLDFLPAMVKLLKVPSGWETASNEL